MRHHIRSKRRKKTSGFKDSDNIEVMVRTADGWHHAAVYNLNTKSYENIDSTYVSGNNKRMLIFNAGVKALEYTCSHAYYYTEINIYPEISLFRTEHVKNILKNNPEKIAVENAINFTVSQDENIILTRDTKASDYAQKVTRESQLKKDIVKTENIKEESRFEVTWNVNFQEKYMDSTGLHYIYQNDGKFYDLLPAGSDFDKSSLVISESGDVLTMGEYSYTLTNNYKNSGRTLLTVEIYSSTKNEYAMQYITMHDYNSINDYGRNLLNSVVYESGNERVGGGFPDNGGNITDKKILKDIDPDTDAEKFAYAEARYEVNFPVAAVTGLKKQIKNSTEKQYSYNTTVHLNEDYSYQVRLANDAMTSSKDIIFFDSLENFFQKLDETTPTKVSDWKGTMTGVDVNNLIFKGISPDIYLSNMDTMNIHHHHDLYETAANGENVWIPYDEFVEKYGLDKATAIAVDATTTVSGNDYVLAPKESISFNVYMKAPAEDTSGKTDPITYNNIYVSRTAMKEAEGEVYEIPQFYHQDYTQAHYRVAGSFNLKKVDESDMTTPIKGITYRLSGTSDYGTEYLEERVSNSKGNMSFETIEKGTYELREVDCSADWQLNMETYTVVINNKGLAEIEGITKDGEIFIVSDKPRIHADIVFLKYNNVTGGMVKNAKFRLSGTSDYGNDYLMYASSNEIGRVDFENVELGTYELSEIEAPSGYIQKKEPWTVKVDERGIASIYDNDKEESKNKTGYYTLINEPYHSIRFVKSSTYGEGIYLEGAEFSLTGVSDYGTSIDMTATSGKADDGGLVVFEGLEPGTYILKETKAPAEHDLNEKPYTVVVNKDGTFTIDGLEKIRFGSKAVQHNDTTEDAGIAVDSGDDNSLTAKLTTVTENNSNILDALDTEN